MATQGPTNPGTAAQDASGTASWTNVNNIMSSAAFTTQSEAIGSSDVTNNLQGTNYGFTIPTGSTIDGITVTFDRKVSSQVSYTNQPVITQLLKAGVAAGTAKTQASNWGTSLVTTTLGGAADKWGTTWTVSDINNSGFGFEMHTTPNNSTGTGVRTQSVQNYTVTITYTPPPAGYISSSWFGE